MSERTQNPGAVTNSFTKGMVKDFNETFVGEGVWTHARNLVNNSHDGNSGTVGNEPATLHCVKLPYTFIGSIALSDDQWAIFTTNDVDCEIGVFDESNCTYRTVVNDRDLNFRRSNLITGVSRRKFDCDMLVYWSDNGRNPDRMMDLNNPPYKCIEKRVSAAEFATNKYFSYFIMNKATLEDNVELLVRYKDIQGINKTIAVRPESKRLLCAIEDSVQIVRGGDFAELIKKDSCNVQLDSKTCFIKACTDDLDIEKLRIAPFVSQPCVELKKGVGSGTLPNGTYNVLLGYTINQTKISDYSSLSNPVAIFDHNNVSGSLEVKFSNLDQNFDEFELVVVYNANGIITAKSFGYYSTQQTTIYIDTIDPKLPEIDTSRITVSNPVYEKSDAMFAVNGYLIRTGLYTKYDFNYQPQANNIKTKWVAVRYAADYYGRTGTNVGYMRDEQYAFFIRWVYNTGDKSASYHIPGRKFIPGRDETWKTHNTASVINIPNTHLPDGGLVVAEGDMGYWESTEKYPDDRPDIWTDNCGVPIRHHKMPDSSSQAGSLVDHFTNDGQSVVVLGVKFENITHPIDESGKPILSIIGYEILRGSREGQKTIVAKGMFNNMRMFDIPNRPNFKGLYQNYPYNDLQPDVFHTSNKGMIDKGSFDDVGDGGAALLSEYSKKIFSFHSPDTTFNKPFLSVQNVKIYQELHGESIGYFEHPHKHPKAKVLGKGVEIVSKVLSVLNIISNISAATGSEPPKLTTVGNKDIPIDVEFNLKKPEPKKSVVGGIFRAIGTAVGLPSLGDAIGGIADGVGNAIRLGGYYAQVATISYISAEVTNAQMVQLIYGLLPYKQYALQYNSHGLYNKSRSVNFDNTSDITSSYYLDSNLQTFNNKYIINNLYRNPGVVLELKDELPDPVVKDQSRKTITSFNTSVGTSVSSPISGYYGAIKTPLQSQYGQLHNVIQMPTFSCVHRVNPNLESKYTSTVIFGGDTYINRYTEKNPFFIFNDWVVDMDNGFEYDYRSSINVPYPRYWIDTTTVEYKLLKSSSDYHRLNDGKGGSGFFYQKPGYFYLFYNGVRDFFVESEINLAFRDWGENLGQRHYDPERYTDLSSMFRSDVIKTSNYFKYDYALSTTKQFYNFLPWAQLLPRDYDPEKANTCYQYEPNKALYSLRQEVENKRDNWRVFLPNNYKDFRSKITTIKSVNKTGALILFERESPIDFVGVDTLKTDAGTKLIIGDGGLFEQPLQNIINADRSYEYGSCQSRYSVLATPQGIFWVSQDQGKIFSYTGKIDEISRKGMKWWFAKYLPSELLKAFPDYPLYDNPVKGVGVQMIYDNTNEIIYITKRDYKPIISGLMYDGQGRFYKQIDGVKTYYELDDTTAFENASWTVSYDPKANDGIGAWLSFHDWKPTFMLPSKTHFMSVNNSDIWKHNSRCDLFCNFYGVDYPFEIEFVSATGQSVTTMKNIEYLLEVYRYNSNCKDRVHLLDANFDHAVIYNSEQISGLLELTLKSKTNPVDLLNYPIVGNDSIKIHFSKEEQKYRFNQFWDITKDRGEFNNQRIAMWNTQANGYISSINPAYVNYSKNPLERKKFRHNVNRVLLSKLKSGADKMIFKISNQKIQPSFR